MQDHPPSKQNHQKLMAIRLPTDWHSWGRGTGQPHTRDKAHRPERRETHGNLNQVRVEKEITADDMGKRAGHVDQQQRIQVGDRKP